MTKGEAKQEAAKSADRTKGEFEEVVGAVKNRVAASALTAMASSSAVRAVVLHETGLLVAAFIGIR